MVDVGPVGPWSGPPDMAVPALERWHAAWERDHPELLGLAGPSFYKPEPVAQVSEDHPVMAGIRPSEVRRILAEMGVRSATEAEIDLFLTRAAREEEGVELAAYRSFTGDPDARPPVCGCGMKIMGCPACYAPHCPSCEQRHVFDCGRRWERQVAPPLHVDPLLIAWQKR